jgi:hypothetical protein
MSPWTYSSNPLIRTPARLLFVFLCIVVPITIVIAGFFVAFTGLIRGLNNITGLFYKYRFRGPALQKEMIPRVPDTPLFFTDTFKLENMRAKDFLITIELPLDYSKVPVTHCNLHTQDVVTAISTFLLVPDLARLGLCSKRSYCIYKMYLEQYCTAEKCKELFKFSITETVFDKTVALDQYRLYFTLCKKLCHHTGRPPESLYKSQLHKGSILIHHLIEQIGPFTFLSIPYVDNFELEPRHAVERTSNRLKDFLEYASTDNIHTMKLRFSMQVNGQVVRQEIRQEGIDWIAQQNGIWNHRMKLKQNHVHFFISLMKNPAGANLVVPVQDAHLRFLSHHNRQYNNIQIHATLTPPLNL